MRSDKTLTNVCHSDRQYTNTLTSTIQNSIGDVAAGSFFAIAQSAAAGAMVLNGDSTGWRRSYCCRERRLGLGQSEVLGRVRKICFEDDREE